MKRSPNIDRVFHALGDPTRRDLLERLAAQDGLSSAEWIRRTLLQQVRQRARKRGF